MKITFYKFTFLLVVKTDDETTSMEGTYFYRSPNIFATSNEKGAIEEVFVVNGDKLSIPAPNGTAILTKIKSNYFFIIKKLN